MQPHGLPHPHPLADRDRSRLSVGADDRPHEEVAALVLGPVLVDDEPEQQPGRRELLLVVGSRAAITSPSRSMAGLPASSADHVGLRGRDRHLRADTGAAPWETHGQHLAPRKRARRPRRPCGPRRPATATRRPAAEALARPPSTGRAGALARAAASSASAGKLYGSQSTISDSSVAPRRGRLGQRFRQAEQAKALGVALRRRSGCVCELGAGQRGRPDDDAGRLLDLAARRRPSPPAPQPIRCRGSRRSCTSERSHCHGRGVARRRRQGQVAGRIEAARARVRAASANASTVSKLSEAPTEVLTVEVSPTTR